MLDIRRFTKHSWNSRHIIVMITMPVIKLHLPFSRQLWSSSTLSLSGWLREDQLTKQEKWGTNAKRITTAFVADLAWILKSMAGTEGLPLDTFSEDCTAIAQLREGNWVCRWLPHAYPLLDSSHFDLGFNLFLMVFPFAWLGILASWETSFYWLSHLREEM